MTSAAAKKAVEATLETIKQRVPAYRELADRFGPMFLGKADLFDTLAAMAPPPPAVDGAKLAAGAPVLAGLDLTPWLPLVEESAKTLLPQLTSVLRLDEKATASINALFADPNLLLGLAQARIEGNWKHFENTSVQLDSAPATVLLFVLESVFSPALTVLADGLGKSLSSHTWEIGHCPICGSSPSIAFLSRKEVTDLDHLVGGGGKKFLHCSLCGHDWRVKRNTCPACGNDDNESREIFTVDGMKHERIEACHKCSTYCLSIDMREVDPVPDLEAAQLGLIHLDIHARKHKLAPMTPTLWNTPGVS
jgi:FdhE protein